MLSPTRPLSRFLRKALTSVEFEGKLVVVLGGYEKGENNVFDMLRCNSGLSGRFTETIRMRDLSDEACTGLLHKKLAAGCVRPAHAVPPCAATGDCCSLLLRLVPAETWPRRAWFQ